MLLLQLGKYVICPDWYLRYVSLFSAKEEEIKQEDTEVKEEDQDPTEDDSSG